MASDIDLVLLESLILGAAAALDDIGDELIGLREGWSANGADPVALAWLDGLIAKAGWWSGRLTAGAESTHRSA